MHTATLRSTAAVRTTTRGFGGGRSKGKGKQREQYADESDEEATLLLGHVERGADGDPDGDDDGDIGGEGQGSTRLKRLEGSQTSRVRCFVLRDGHRDRTRR
jgi:phospholipid-translocating ATPase